MTEEWDKSDADWKRQLTPERYQICRGKGTEPPFTGKYWDHHETGVYRCSCRGAPLFASEAKFDSGSGWPSFTQPVTEENVREEPDLNHGMVRTEVLCRRCNSHLGHVFDDGPQAAGLRYCINSAALDFQKGG